MKVRLYFQLDERWGSGQCAVRLERAAYRLEEFANRCGQGSQPQVPLDYANFRIFMWPISSAEAAEHFHKLAKFPIQLGLSVSYAIGSLMDEYNPRNPTVFRDNLPISESDFRHWADANRKARDLIKVAQAQIAHAMHERYGTSFPMPSDIADVAKRVERFAVKS